MNEKQLLTYLTDHLAGSEMALELIEASRKHNDGTPLETFLAQLYEEIGEDRRVLEGLIARFGEQPSAGKMASAWLMEKGMRMKTKGFGYDALSRLDELEFMLLGIRGKLALWVTLQEIRFADARLQEVDYQHLQQRAQQQMDSVDARRLEAARQAFLD